MKSFVLALTLVIGFSAVAEAGCHGRRCHRHPVRSLVKHIASHRCCR